MSDILPGVNLNALPPPLPEGEVAPTTDAAAARLAAHPPEDTSGWAHPNPPDCDMTCGHKAAITLAWYDSGEREHWCRPCFVLQCSRMIDAIGEAEVTGELVAAPPGFEDGRGPSESSTEGPAAAESPESEPSESEPSNQPDQTSPTQTGGEA